MSPPRDLPGVPSRNRLPSSPIDVRETVVAPNAHPAHDHEHASPHMVAPLVMPKAPGLLDRMKGSGSLLVAVIIALGGGTGIAALRKDSGASSAEINALRAELADAKMADIRRDIAEIKTQLKAKSESDDRVAAKVNDVARQTELVAEFAAKLNAGTPARDWPQPADGWYAQLSPPPRYRTDRAWSLLTSQP